MISKPQVDATYSDLLLNRAPRMNAAQRALVKWATIEEHDQVLDTDCGSGAMLLNLMDKYHIRACGLCPFADEARQTRDTIQNSEIVFARPDDIPFRDSTFHVLLSASGNICSKNGLKEALRVMKPGGQLIVSCATFSMFHAALSDSGEIEMSRREKMRALQEAGFCNVTWRASGINGVIIGWKESEIDQKPHSY